MNIGILTSTDPQLRHQLTADGTAAQKAQPVEAEIVAVAKPRPTGNTAPSVKFLSLRAALDARIAVDMSSGQLSAGDAAAVQKTLDGIDSGSAGTHWAPMAAVPAKYGKYDAAATPQQVARAYLATIERGTLIDRWA